MVQGGGSWNVVQPRYPRARARGQVEALGEEEKELKEGEEQERGGEEREQ